MRKQKMRNAVGSVLEAQLRAELLPFNFSTMSATRVPAALVPVDCTDSLPETTDAVDKAQPPAAHDENDAPQVLLSYAMTLRLAQHVHLFAQSLGRTDVACRNLSSDKLRMQTYITYNKHHSSRIMLYLKAPNNHTSCATGNAAGLRLRRGHPDAVPVVQRVAAWERASIAAERAHQAEGTESTERSVRRKVPPPVIPYRSTFFLALKPTLSFFIILK